MPSEPAAPGVPLTSDSDMRRIAVGPVTLHNAPIVLAAYDRRWPHMFAREASRIRQHWKA